MKLRAMLLALVAVVVMAGGAGPSFAQANVVTAKVWMGPYGSYAAGNYLNRPFTSVTICVPGTANCQTISGVLVDTGSWGLRIFKQVKTLTLPQVHTTGGNPIAECVPFGSATAWGPVERADVKLGGEPTISNLPIQIINANYPPLPASCNFGTPLVRNPAQVNFNGILGVGLFRYDGNGAFYYTCPALGCFSNPGVVRNKQVQNPVASLPVDNNGVILNMPAIPSSGAFSANGQLIFGISTESNNQLGATIVYQTNAFGEITTVYKSGNNIGFLDSGSNGLFFSDASIPRCSGSPFYCPGSTLGLFAANIGVNGTSAPIGLAIANTISLVNGGGVAFNDLGAAFGGGGFFDLGLPFFFGRRVFVGISGGSPSPVSGQPFWAY